MLFSNCRVNKIINKKQFDTCEILDSNIISIFSFPNNEKNHFLSIYENGKIREYLTEPLVDIGDYYMERPQNDFLSSIPCFWINSIPLRKLFLCVSTNARASP